MSLKTLFLFAITTNFAVSLQPCQTPCFQDGDCIPRKQCQSLTHEAKNVREEDYRTSSTCDYTNDEERVCCHLRPSQTLDRASTGDFVRSELLPGPDKCGINESEERDGIKGGIIMGGDATKLFPWMALLAYSKNDKYYRCSGVLINDRYVLTAAHCIDTNLVNVSLGDYDLHNRTDSLEVPIEEHIIFKYYRKRGSFVPSLHDIALIRLKHKVNFTSTIKPICLPNTINEIFANHYHESMIMSGWGKENETYYNHLKQTVELPIKPCKNDYRTDASHICAGGEKGKDSCDGDSGGPLMYRKPRITEYELSNWYIFGLVSSGRVCGGDHLGWYTRVSKYMYWIVNNLKQ